MAILGVTFLGIMTKLLIAVNVIVCFMLIFVVLLQRPKNEGLGAAFGGDTASNIFGAQTTNVLANLTRWLAGIFMVLTLVLSILYSKNEESRTAACAFIEKARKDKEADETRKKNEDAAKAAADAKTGAQPAATSEPVKIETGAPKIEIGQPAAPAPVVPEAPKTPAPAPADTKAPEPPKPAEPAPEPEPAKPADAPAPAPAKPADAPAPAPAKPADAPAPEPAKPN